jgi:hypothetical protein
MFLTKKHISRRAVLKGAGVTLALPLLDSMVPAQTPLKNTAAAPTPRFTGIWCPHGAAPGYWVPEKVGTGFEFTPIFKPLEPFRDHTVILSGMWSKSAEPPPGVTGADHWVASAFMSARKPKKTDGADFLDGTTIDQLIARKIGQNTLLPSIQLGLEDPGAGSNNCGEGYSCVYTNSVSWASPTQPLPMELDPQVVFERMFGVGGTQAERALHRQQDASILDSVTQSLASFKTGLGAGDRRKLDEYTSDIRELERRMALAKKATGSVNTEGIEVPSGVPEAFDDHVKLHQDLIWLAYKADITRVAGVLYARDLTARVYPKSGSNSGFHGASHHAENPDRIKDYSHINTYHVACLSYLVDKLAKTPDGDGTLLDHSLILYGSNMGDSNQHLHYDVPHVLVGGACGKLKGGRHLHFPTKTISTGNLLLSILALYDVHQSSIGDSTGELPGLV